MFILRMICIRGTRGWQCEGWQAERVGNGSGVLRVDWLNGLEPRPTTGIIYFHEFPQTIEALIPNILAEVDQAMA